jgi:hypothetical protein
MPALPFIRSDSLKVKSRSVKTPSDVEGPNVIKHISRDSRVDDLKWRLAGKKAKLNTLNSITGIDIWEVL